VAAGDLGEGEVLTHDSIVGSRFTARVTSSGPADGFPAVVPSITGIAYPTGEHVFDVDPDDDLVPGFVLR
jgi:proline racemase